MFPACFLNLDKTRDGLSRRPNKRRFQRANSGVIFEFFQKENPDTTSPVIFLLASDASFSGQHREHHPIYRAYSIYDCLKVLKVT